MEEPQCAARDTTVEGRLSDLENTVRNEQETQRRYWRAVEQGGELADRERERLVARLKALEERLSDPPTWKTFEAALERIEELEAAWREFNAERAPSLEQRVEGCEEQLARLGLLDYPEMVRQARWHETYNAALPLAQRVFNQWAESERYNLIHAECATVADRAHGPLDAKQNAVEDDPHIASLFAEYRAQVTALVKAAQLARIDCSLSMSSDVMEQLEAALRPFEREAGK